MILAPFKLSKLHREDVFFVIVALCPKSTGMAITGRLVHLSTLFPGQA